jgi:hypothetical protein
MRQRRVQQIVPSAVPVLIPPIRAEQQIAIKVVLLVNTKRPKKSIVQSAALVNMLRVLVKQRVLFAVPENIRHHFLPVEQMIVLKIALRASTKLLYKQIVMYAVLVNIPRRREGQRIVIPVLLASTSAIPRKQATTIMNWTVSIASLVNMRQTLDKAIAMLAQPGVIQLTPTLQKHHA